MLKVVAFVPAGDGDVIIRSCLQYCEARGYLVAELIRGDWPRALGMVVGGTVSAIVFPRRGHGKPSNAAPAAAVGERTRRLRVVREPVRMDREEVLRLLDGESTVPLGLNPESIAAARRIAAHFAECKPS